MRALKFFLIVALASAAVACGGGGGGSSPPPPSTFTVSGSISGLLPNRSVVLVDNGANATTFSANGNYKYTGAIASGTGYAITVQTQPVGETCTVTNGSGAVSSANVTNVTVTCTPNTYTVTATVAGLAAGQNLTLELNGLSTTAVSANGSYTFSTPVPSGSTYAVMISTPAPGQPCAVTNGSGTIVAANVSNVQVNCGATSYNVSVNLTGLPYGTSITLQNNADMLQLTQNGSANFPTPVAYNAGYSVTVTASPANTTCNLSSSIGTVTGPVTISVDCPHFAYVSNATSSDVSIFSINNATGALTSESPLSNAGTTPYGIAISPALGFVYVVSYGNTGVNGFASDPASGALTAISPTNTFPTDNNPLCMAFNAAGTFAFVTNFGSNSVTAFAADPGTGALTAAGAGSFPAGSGPFGIAVSPIASYVYVANSNDGTVEGYSFDNTGALTAIGTTTVGSVDPELAIDPRGGYLYVLANPQGVAVTGAIYTYAIGADGSLTATGSPVATGNGNPSGIAIHPSGKFLYVANFDSTVGGNSSVSAYSIDSGTGLPTAIGNTIPAGTGTESVAVDPTGQYLYATNQVSSDIYGYSIDANLGSLTPLTSGPFAAGTKPEEIVFR